MTVKTMDVYRAAHLARLKIEGAEETCFTERLSKVFDWIATLNTLPVEGVAPLINPMEEHLDLQMPLRKDIPEKTEDLILREAPSAAHDMFRVPKVIE